MALHSTNQEQVVIAEEFGHVRVSTMNRPRQLNAGNMQSTTVQTQYLEKWEKDNDAELIIFKGAGRAFSVGGDLSAVYKGRADFSSYELFYRIYWLAYHVHTYRKTTVSLVHGMIIGGGNLFLTPVKFSVVTEKTVFGLPEVAIGLHPDASFSYVLPRLPGRLGEFFGLTGSRLKGKDIVAARLATHFVPSERLNELEKSLVSLNSGDEAAVRALIEEHSSDVKTNEGSILNKLPIINKCFSAKNVEEIMKSLEAEASKEGNEWISTVLSAMKRSSPTSLKITLKSIREGRKQTLAECLKTEFRLTRNILKSTISGDLFEGIRAMIIDKDNAPKWNPSNVEEVSDEKVNMIFSRSYDGWELQIPDESHRWMGRYDTTVYSYLKGKSSL